jgi:hypothetical protein
MCALTVRRNAGSVKINGVSYIISKDTEGAYTYNRRATPKAQLTTGRRGTASGEANMLEYSWGADQGMGDATQTKNRDHYNYGMNFFMEHEGEAVVLPGALRHELSSGSVEPFKSPTAIFEIIDDSDAQDALSTYWLQDSMCLKIAGAASPEFNYTIEKTFEAKTNPSDATVFNNIAYIGMGGAHRRINIIGAATSSGVTFTTDVAHGFAVGDMIRITKSNHSTADTYNGIWIVNSVGSTVTFNIASTNLAFVAMSPPTVPLTGVVFKLTNRYLRRFRNGIWSLDDNSLKSVTAVASSVETGEVGSAKFTTASAHGYSVGDYVYLTHFLVSAYNSMTPEGLSTLYQITTVGDSTHFTINALTFTSTSVGRVNRQDSDVIADSLAIVGDIMIRSYEDEEGWKVSRVDIVNSNPMLDANWTAGVGTKSVGSGDSPITDLVPVGKGELVMSAEGAFVYDLNASAYLNQIPELEEHRHPTNGKNSFEWKGWVYIPTIIGVFRWKNGTTQNVTPGLGGQSDFTTPIGPVGGFAGDTERLFAVTQPFKVSQPKNIVAPAPTRMYLDPTEIHPADNASDWGLDPQQDLNGFSAAGYLYVGATKPWHRMYFEIDPQANTLAASATGTATGSGATTMTDSGAAWATNQFAGHVVTMGNSTATVTSNTSTVLTFSAWSPVSPTTGIYSIQYSGLKVDAVDYWNGATWTAETNYVNYTSVRAGSATLPSAFGQSGDIWFSGPVPSNWAVSGTAHVVSGGITLNASYYWKRFSFNAAITNSVIIKRTIAGIHDAASTFTAFGTTDLQIDSGGAQFVLSMTERQGEGVVWQTMWGWQPFEQTQSDGTNTYNSGGSQPIGCLGIVQPNKMRSGATGTRWLFVGGYNTNMLCPLGHAEDPTEDGPYMQVLNSVGQNGLTAARKAILVLPDSDCGLPYVTKVLQEVNFDTDGITVASDIEVFYRADRGAWTTVGDVTVLPHKMTAGSEPSGLTFGLAVVVTLTESTYVVLPRLTTLPSIRLFARPEMSEVITMSVELDAETVLPGQSDRRVNKTSYAALKALQSNTVSVSYSDVDESTDNVHVQQVAKRVTHSGENIPVAVADIVLSVVP